MLYESIKQPTSGVAGAQIVWYGGVLGAITLPDLCWLISAAQYFCLELFFQSTKKSSMHCALLQYLS